jgi:hypothetical protein
VLSAFNVLGEDLTTDQKDVWGFIVADCKLFSSTGEYVTLQLQV